MATTVAPAVPPAPPEALPMELARALGDPLRWRIVELLAAEQLCVAHLAEELGIAQPLVSHHLRVLREAGLVEPDATATGRTTGCARVPWSAWPPPWGWSPAPRRAGPPAGGWPPVPTRLRPLPYQPLYPKEAGPCRSATSCSSVSTTPAAARWRPPSSTTTPRAGSMSARPGATPATRSTRPWWRRWTSGASTCPGSSPSPERRVRPGR